MPHDHPRLWLLGLFLLCAAHANLRGRVRFGWVRALSDFTVLLAPLNSLLYLGSRVRPRPYANVGDFPELAPLQQHWRTIRDEAMRLNGDGLIRAADGHTDLGFNSFFRTGWTRFYLKWYGDELPSARALCPETVALLGAIPSIKGAMFASLPPAARLVRHRDPYAGSLRYHLGLVTPGVPGCYIEVDGQRYHWRDGEAVMFDETFIHHAENTTGQPRVILFCDVERPMRWGPFAAINRWFSGHVMKTSQAENVAGDPVGGLNKIFHRIYQMRLWGKALKKRSRATYYVTKWIAILGLVYLIFF